MSRTHNRIVSSTHLAVVLKNIENKVINLWTLLPFNTAVDKPLTVIAEGWQHAETPQVMHDCLEYLLFPVMMKRMTWYEYNKLATEYEEGIIPMNADEIYEFSVQIMLKAGYKL